MGNLIFFILGLVSAYLLYDTYKYTRKGEIPGWLEKAMAKGIPSKGMNEVGANTTTIFGILFLFFAPILAMFPVASAYARIRVIFGIENNYRTLWNLIGDSPLLWIPGTALFIYANFVMRKQINRRGDHHLYEVPKINERERIRNSHGVKGWPSRQEIEAAITDNNPGGINVTGGEMSPFWSRKGHVLTVGYARSGKGTNIILQTLLNRYMDYSKKASFVILDPKGENAAIAGDYLKKSGYNVMVMNPFDILEISKFGNVRFNPFDLFNESTPGFTKYVDYD